LLPLHSAVYTGEQERVGRVVDIFGKIAQPFYSIEASRQPPPALAPGLPLFFSRECRLLGRPEIDSMRQRRGTDAGWQDLDSSSDDDEDAVRQSSHHSSRPPDPRALPQKRLARDQLQTLVRSLGLSEQDLARLTLQELLDMGAGPGSQ
jgi:rRNA processing protein Gar1